MDDNPLHAVDRFTLSPSNSKRAGLLPTLGRMRRHIVAPFIQPAAPAPAEMPRSRKPDPATAMRLLIGQVRSAVPFDVARARTCDGRCDGCSQKLLDWLEGELDDWQARLAAGELPRLGDIDRLARSSRKVYAVLARNGLVPPPS